MVLFAFGAWMPFRIFSVLFTLLESWVGACVGRQLPNRGNNHWNNHWELLLHSMWAVCSHSEQMLHLCSEEKWSQGVTFPSQVLPRHSQTQGFLKQASLLAAYRLNPPGRSIPIASGCRGCTGSSRDPASLELLVGWRRTFSGRCSMWMQGGLSGSSLTVPVIRESENCRVGQDL